MDVDQAVEFYFNGEPVGLFVAASAPLVPGAYRYEPYGTTVHHDFCVALAEDGIVECVCQLGRKTYFLVTGVDSLRRLIISRVFIRRRAKVASADHARTVSTVRPRSSPCLLPFNSGSGSKGKTVARLIEELQSIEDQEAEIRVSLDEGQTSYPISLVGDLDGMCAVLINCRAHPHRHIGVSAIPGPCTPSRAEEE
ncbi:hypothetical protein [Lysobacter terrae]